MKLFAGQKSLTCLEWKHVSIGDGATVLTPAQADRLCHLAETRARVLKLGPEAVLARRHNHVKAGQVCGVLAAPDVTLEILPKLDIDGAQGRDVLIHMLDVAYDLRIASDGLAGLGTQKLDLLEVTILSFARRLTATLRRGLPRRYLTDADDLSVLRGSLDIKRQFTVNAVRPDRLACRYDELTANTPLNRVVFAAARLLARRTGLAATYTMLNDALDRMEGVGISRDPLREPVSLDRTNTAWHGVYRMARLLLAGASQSARSDAHEGFALLFPMNDLFEKYTANLMHRRYGRAVRRQAKGKAVTKSGLFRMKPDILVDRGYETLIIDTKWKQLDLSDAKAGVSQSDVYQMLAYGHAYGRHDGNTRLMLLYPARDGQGTGIFKNWIVEGSGFGLQIATLDLSARDVAGKGLEGLVGAV
ncbi:McrC family protein [Shimia abyssi]|uniref:5-methylcytosine-specific restriction enzyme subunit McrC n=1 Tax=Shimia abyssi TaxID=1662395 RepID=A0A2P8F2V6_9RHOB|nr:hypothetical protein [Shimia abyssi]PSL16050.1 5-methylcytosine-specific restriction enzyme subunit McrC [Shimia abyssi]